MDAQVIYESQTRIRPTLKICQFAVLLPVISWADETLRLSWPKVSSALFLKYSILLFWKFSVCYTSFSLSSFSEKDSVSVCDCLCPVAPTLMWWSPVWSPSDKRHSSGCADGVIGFVFPTSLLYWTFSSCWAYMYIALFASSRCAPVRLLFAAACCPGSPFHLICLFLVHSCFGNQPCLFRLCLHSLYLCLRCTVFHWRWTFRLVVACSMLLGCPNEPPSRICSIPSSFRD